MGLLSKFGKDKQDAAGEDSGYYRAQDDRSLSDKARSKRASNAGAGADAAPRRGGRKDAADPVLPEKKRARRRLVGAIALALGVAIGLPMLLDSEPKSSVADIAINMPSKDKPGEPLNGGPATAPAPVPAPAVAQQAAPAVAVPAAAAPVAAPASRAVAPVATGAALDKGEEIVHVPAKPVVAEPAKPPKAAEPKVAKPEPKHTEPKPEPKKDAKPDTKPAHADDARAMAILEGKPADAAPATKYVIKVGAFAAKDKVDELQRKLGEAGIKSYAQKVSTANGELTSVRVGPFPNKEEAEKVKAKLGKLGLNGSLTPA
ncbi:SPOR domain-containing protein [Pseudoduganella sp. DS3]|uniref:SPOR domain-containing protein n=1 Tax=Pseudoduganella guangdongensis TaxID=2692179 RepID=A0A6N9HPZ5_9BURK|nr:SPOR domain-containing protein [Pseudoduganella guangdongensis]MYN05600.1 SPOR domain-containing protein [Pseudoduganella guangdongensis]